MLKNVVFDGSIRCHISSVTLLCTSFLLEVSLGLGMKPAGMRRFFIYLFIDIQHAPLHSNTTCFKYSQYSYIYLDLCTISSIFYSYGRFIFGSLIQYLLLLDILSTALLTNYLIS